MQFKLTRRKFLQSTGVSAAALSVSGPNLLQAASEIDPLSSSSRKFQYIPTVCGLCPARCHIMAKIRDGELVGISGNPKSPYNGSSVCARALASRELVYSPDRLRYPLKRTGKRGEGKWVRISWGEAIDTITFHLEKTLHNVGPQSIALFLKGPSSRYIRELFHEFSISHINDSTIEHCELPRELAYRATFGQPPGYLDYAHTDCIVLMGSHFGENVMVPELQDLVSAINRGASLIVVDPRFSAIAGKADHYLQIRPGTDTALLLGWINHIIESGLYDIEHIEKYGEGFAELRQAASRYPLDVVSRLTDIPEELISQTAHIIGKSAPSVIIHPGRHASWYGNDFERLRTKAAFSGILGAWARKGSVYPQRFLADLKEEASFSYNQKWMSDRLNSSVDKAATIFKKINKGEIRFVGNWGQNPFHAYPNPYRTAEAFTKADFVFTCDIQPSDPALYADIILPEATFFERYDGISPALDGNIPCLALGRPVISPLYEARDSYWIVKQLSNRLGRGDGFVFSSEEERIASDLKLYGLGLLDFSFQDGVIIHSGTVREEIFPSVLPTASGKIEFRSSFLAERGHAPVPDFSTVPEMPVGYYRLISGKSPVHSQTTTSNSRSLGHEMPENELWINDEEARRQGFADGENVILLNQDGITSLKPARLKLTPGIRKDCVYTVHGFGSRSHLLHYGYDRGFSDSYLMTRSQPDPVSGCRGLRTNFVRLVKVG